MTEKAEKLIIRAGLALIMGSALGFLGSIAHELHQISVILQHIADKIGG